MDLEGIAAPARVWMALRARSVESRFEALRTNGLTALVGSARLFSGTRYVVRGHRFRIHDPIKFGRRHILELQCRLLERQVVVECVVCNLRRLVVGLWCHSHGSA
jgi:hypothetical protein